MKRVGIIRESALCRLCRARHKRHTFASHQKMNGTDDFTLMELLGHSDFTMMKRYAHLTPEHKRKAINCLPEWKGEEAGHKMVTNSDANEKGLQADIL